MNVTEDNKMNGTKTMNVNKININQSEQTYYIASDIYDVSAHNNGVTFESLSALLSAENLSTLIPSAIRCGGMSIRFVLSSDNKYVQYRLMTTFFSTTESDWYEVAGAVGFKKLADDVKSYISNICFPSGDKPLTIEVNRETHEFTYNYQFMVYGNNEFGGTGNSSGSGIFDYGTDSIYFLFGLCYILFNKITYEIAFISYDVRNNYRTSEWLLVNVYQNGKLLISNNTIVIVDGIKSLPITNLADGVVGFKLLGDDVKKYISNICFPSGDKPLTIEVNRETHEFTYNYQYIVYGDLRWTYENNESGVFDYGTNDWYFLMGLCYILLNKTTRKIAFISYSVLDNYRSYDWLLVNVYQNGKLLISNNTIVIVDGIKSVSITNLADGAVTTDNIADGAVTYSKLSSDIKNDIAKDDCDLGCINYQKPVSKINHFIIYGQSLSTGLQTCPPVSTHNVRGNLMMGDFEWSYNAEVANKLLSLNPLIARAAKGIDYIPTDKNDQSYGETPCIGFANASKIMIDNYLINTDKVFMATSCGLGGLSIELLSKNCPNNNSARYTKFLDTLTKANELKGDKSLSCSALIWMQGEWNESSTVDQGWEDGEYSTANKDDYKAYLIGGTVTHKVTEEGESTRSLLVNGLVNDMLSDIKSEYSQENNPIVLCTQPGCAFMEFFEMPIYMAFLEAHNEKDELTLVTPLYRVTDRGGHLDANGSCWVGELLAKVYYKRVILGKNWKPLQPNYIKRNQKTILIKFDVPEPPLVFDTNQVRAVSDYGFSIRVNGVKKAISSVSIISTDTVEIIMNDIISSSDIVEISYAGLDKRYGNLRDSDKWVSRAVYKDLDSLIENPEGISYRPTWEPKDENGDIIYGKSYPCQNFCLHYYYKLEANVNKLVINTK